MQKSDVPTPSHVFVHLHDFMVNEAHLALDDGCWFSNTLSQYVRLNAACPRIILKKALQQLVLQTERLEVTRQVFVLDSEKALERELLLLKVESDVHNRTELREIACIYKAKIIDLSPDSMVFELIGRPDKLDAFLKMFEGYNILEQCRTGVTALERGGMHQHMQKPPQEVRAVQLPLPGTHCPERT